MDLLISGPDHPRWTDPQFLALAQHKQETAMPPFDKSTIPEGYMLVPIVLPPGIVTQATPAVELRDKPGNMVERVWRLLISALQAKGY